MRTLASGSVSAAGGNRTRTLLSQPRILCLPVRKRLIATLIEEERQLAAIRSLHEAGVRLLVGTDASRSNPAAFGISLHREMEIPHGTGPFFSGPCFTTCQRASGRFVAALAQC